jgi:hypothetical protein
MVGGKIRAVLKINENKLWLNVQDTTYKDECGVYVDPVGETLRPGDRVWWQGSTCYWTPASEERVEVKLTKVGGSGISVDQALEALREELTQPSYSNL